MSEIIGQPSPADELVEPEPEGGRDSDGGDSSGEVGEGLPRMDVPQLGAGVSNKRGLPAPGEYPQGWIG